MISFSAGEVELSVLWHENFHQWWGDNVSEADYEIPSSRRASPSGWKATCSPRTCGGRAFNGT